MDIHTTLRGKTYVFQTKPGLFSKNKIDEGTTLLIETMEIKPTDVVLDLGCGYGPIGLVAANLASRGKIYLVDTDIRAVKYSRINMKVNNVKNATVLASDGFDEVANIMFDVIVSNPPSHLPKETLIEFVEGAKRQLKPGGKLYFVTEKRIRPLIKREFERVFGSYEAVGSRKQYVVSKATS